MSSGLVLQKKQLSGWCGNMMINIDHKKKEVADVVVTVNYWRVMAPGAV